MPIIAETFEYIIVVLWNYSASGKTKCFQVNNRSSGSELGEIAWSGPWRQYTFRPVRAYGTIYSAGCLRDIAEFLTAETARQRGKSKQK